MANEEHLSLLRQGVKAWNTWREKNSDVEIDLRSANLSRSDLSKVNLSGANLNKANLSYTDLKSAYLGEADLSYAILRSACLSYADLSRSDLSGVNLRSADLSSAILSHAILNNADLSNTNLSSASLSYTDLSKANFRKANLICTDLSHSSLKSASLSYTDLRNADLSYANLKNINLSGANLSSVNLKSANLSGANLSYADLRGADLSGAILNYAILKSVNLSNANLLLADLSSADLSNSDLSNSDLSSARLRLSQALSTNFMEADLTGACIAYWQVNRETNFEDVECNYIYRGYDTQKNKFTERLPVNPDRFFQAREFEEWIRTSAEAQKTIDLTFSDGIDWQTFSQSLQGVRQEYPDSGVGLQAIERKGSAFVISLEATTESDQSAIELRILELYDTKFHFREARGEIRVLREWNEYLKQLAGEEKNKPTSQTTIHAQNIEVQHSDSGDIKGITQNIGNNLDEISFLVQSLKEAAQIFPEEHKEIALKELKDLEEELQTPETIKPQRIGRLLKRLLVAGAATATLAGITATGVDLFHQANEFTANVLELANELGVEPIQDKQQIE